MNKWLQMAYYNILCKTNPVLAKSSTGRSVIMKEAVIMSKSYSILFYKIYKKP